MAIQIPLHIVWTPTPGTTTLIKYRPCGSSTWLTPSPNNPTQGSSYNMMVDAAHCYEIKFEFISDNVLSNFVCTKIMSCGDEFPVPTTTTTSTSSTTTTSSTVPIVNTVEITSTMGGMSLTQVTGIAGFTLPETVEPGETVDGTHLAFTGAISLTLTGTLAINPSNIYIEKNGVAVQCINVTAAGVYTSNSFSWNTSDEIKIFLNTGSC